MSVKPLFDRVLVRRKESETKSGGGLFLPDSARKKSHLAEVIATGHGRLSDAGKLTSLFVEPGMTVLLSEWSGDEVKIDGTNHLFVREADILGVSID